MGNSILKVDQINKSTASYITVGDPITLVAGTASAGTAPAKFNSGTNLTTAEAGALEYDGKVFYSDHAASSRGVLPSVIFSSNVGDFTLSNTANAQSWLEAARDVLTVTTLTTYEMEGLIQINGMGATTRTTALEFDAGNCSFTSISYFATIYTGGNQTITTTFGAKHCIAATAQILNATVATVASTIFFKGFVRINAGGTFIPQIKWSADPLSNPTLLCLKDSYIKLMPLGTNTIGSVGNWA